jgi:four helix bundle protein
MTSGIRLLTPLRPGKGRNPNRLGIYSGAYPGARRLPDGQADWRTGGRRKLDAKEELISRNDFRYSELNGSFLMYGMMPYERFEAWKITHQLALQVYSVTERWPKSERYELTSQIRRASLSAPTNIAEGAAKRGRQEFRRFLDIARGSLSEVSYLLRFSKDRGI